MGRITHFILIEIDSIILTTAISSMTILEIFLAKTYLGKYLKEQYVDKNNTDTTLLQIFCKRFLINKAVVKCSEILKKLLRMIECKHKNDEM